ncbi:hypothetical protein KKG45_10750, partial [bacterium]|nr:hypothetical protein [bacterium]
EPQPTRHPGIRVARSRRDTAGAAEVVDALLAAAEAGNMRECWPHLLRLAPDFQGDVRERAAPSAAVRETED